MHTEDEAKKKWCPEHRTAGLIYRDGRNVIVSANSKFDEGQTIGRMKCIASECMHWRWMGAVSWEQEMNAGPGAERRGFCGLSGRPE